jgi:FSR family fosmidomycin resistance protein-like MFS transporter
MLDELVFGVREAAWPAVRVDLGLSYVQVGLLLTVPGLVAAIVEPAIGLAGDTRHRRVIVLVGGLAFGAALLATGLAPGFAGLLAATIVLYPASGAFVGLSQANLMDAAPERREPNMARWVVAGSVGTVAGPLAFAAAAFGGFGWRSVLVVAAAPAVALAAAAWAVHPSHGGDDDTSAASLLRTAFHAAREREVVRWLLVLELQDLQGDLLLGFLALYLVDVAGVSPVAAGIAVAVWSVAGLAGAVWLVRATRRMDGVRYLRISTGLALMLFPTFLLVPPLVPKLIAVAALAAVTAGWYPIAQARLFAAMPGASGTAIALSSLASLAGAVLPLAVATAAEHLGLSHAMWLLLVGPIAVLTLLPRGGRGPVRARLAD